MLLILIDIILFIIGLSVTIFLTACLWQAGKNYADKVIK